MLLEEVLTTPRTGPGHRNAGGTGPEVKAEAGAGTRPAMAMKRRSAESV